MLKICAPGFVTRVTKHSVMVRYAGKFGLLPKGPGVPRDAGVEALRGVDVEQARIRKATQDLRS